MIGYEFTHAENIILCSSYLYNIPVFKSVLFRYIRVQNISARTVAMEFITRL